MKKSYAILALFLVSFLILGVFAHSFVLADGDNSGSGESGSSSSENSGGSDSGTSENSGSNSRENDDSNSGLVDDNEDNEDNSNDSREKGDTFRNITKTSEDGSKSRTRTLNRTLNEDGTVTETRIETETRGNETRTKIKTRTFTLDGERDLEVETELEVNEDSQNQSRLKVKIRGENRSIILPEHAAEIARLRLQALNITNITLREVNRSNLPRVLYEIETNENGRFLGIFKLRLRAHAQVDAETGDVKTRFPWWAVFVTRDSSIKDSTTNSTNNNTEVTNQVPALGNETNVNETVVVNDTNPTGIIENTTNTDSNNTNNSA